MARVWQLRELPWLASSYSMNHSLRISFRSTCIFLFLLHSFDDSAIFELRRAVRSRFPTLLNYVIANKLLRSGWTRPIESIIPFVTD